MSKNKKEAAARARLGRDAIRRSGLTTQSVSSVPNLPPDDIDDADTESDWDCGYDGGVGHNMSENETEAWTDDDDASNAESLCELEGEELEANFRVLMAEGTPFEMFHAKKTAQEWKKAERNRNLGYNGLSLRRRQEIAKKAKEDAATRKAAKTS
jgi:hypothetical protein